MTSLVFYFMMASLPPIEGPYSSKVEVGRVEKVTFHIQGGKTFTIRYPNIVFKALPSPVFIIKDFSEVENDN